MNGLRSAQTGSSANPLASEQALPLPVVKDRLPIQRNRAAGKEKITLRGGSDVSWGMLRFRERRC